MVQERVRTHGAQDMLQQVGEDVPEPEEGGDVQHLSNAVGEGVRVLVMVALVFGSLCGVCGLA
jgi:hypothetical protein